MVYETDIKELKLFKKGKVRDVYELGENLLFVATDRISCFDVVIPTPIPEKGKVLNQISLFWFSYMQGAVANHLISVDLADLPENLAPYHDLLRDRFMVVKKCKVIPFECVVRGYLSGSGWKEYTKNGKVCGIPLPAGLKESDRLEQPIFTPAIKAESGHDENVDFEYMASKIGEGLASRAREISVSLYQKARLYAEQKGIILADTKFEFGFDGETLVLVDEVLTPDSSRFWPKDTYQPGGPQESYDKQFVRDYLDSTGWDKNPPAPALPDEIVEKTRKKYHDALVALAGVSISTGT